MPLRGEYIWDGSYLQGADSNIDDAGHEGVIIQKIAGMYAEDFLHVLENYRNKFAPVDSDEYVAPDEEELLKDPAYQRLDAVGYDIHQLDSIVSNLESWESGMGGDPEDVHTAFEMLHAIEPENYSDSKLIEGMKVLHGGDARLYGVKNFGDIIIRDNSFEVWGWNKAIARSVLSAVYGIIGENLENDPEEYDQEIDIYDYKTKKSYTMTIRELEQNPMQFSSVPPSVIQTKKGAMSILDPRSRGSSKNWQGVYTSEGFLNYLKKRDPELYEQINGVT